MDERRANRGAEAICRGAQLGVQRDGDCCCNNPASAFVYPALDQAEIALNLTLIGVAWVVADSLARPRRQWGWVPRAPDA
jgi:hypothetical protein